MVGTLYYGQFGEVSGLGSFKYFFKSGSCLQRSCTLSAGVFNFEPPCIAASCTTSRRVLSERRTLTEVVGSAAACLSTL